MKTSELPIPALKLLNLIYKQVSQVTQDDRDKDSFYIHCKDGTTIKLKAEVINKGGAEILH